MAQRIEKDVKRFNDIVKGRIKKNLKQYITQGNLEARKGDKKITIPVPQIQIPRFRFGQQETGGVSSGDGEVGQPISPGDQEGSGEGKPGDSAGDHSLEVEVEIEELAEMLGEELELPRIEPKGRKTIRSVKDKYSSLRKTGPESLRQFKKTYINALKRQISSGTYNFEDPIIIPQRPDKRYRSWKETHEPESNAVIFLMMDVSGSMGAEQKELVRLNAFWIELWLKSQFSNIEIVYIIHDAYATEVDSERFYKTRESGGTKISSALELCYQVILKRFPPSDWNIYGFYFSDGDNWDGNDNALCVDLLRDKLLKAMNLFCYGQCKSAYGSGEFINVMEQNFVKNENVSIAQINGKEDVLKSIKIFLGKGK